MSQLSSLPIEIRTSIAQHIDIPDEPPDHIQLYMADTGAYNYYDLFGPHGLTIQEPFRDLHDECAQRAARLDGLRTTIEAQEHFASQQAHFEEMTGIQNMPGISFQDRARQQADAWRAFTIRTQLLFNYRQKYNFEEQILMKRLAEYRRQNVYAA